MSDEPRETQPPGHDAPPPERPKRFFSERPEPLPDSPPLNGYQMILGTLFAYKLGCCLLWAGLFAFVIVLAMLDRLFH